MTKDAASTVLAILKNLVIGAVLGIANVIPGVSGGTMAASFGIYDQLIQLLSHLWTELRKNWKKNLLFLLPLGAGLVISILLCSKLVSFLLEHYNVPANFFFIGVILGSIPMILGKTVKPKARPSLLLPFLLTLSLMVLMAISSGGEQSAVRYTELTVPVFFLMLLFGAVAAACMIVPGISGSFVMMLIGAYGSVIKAVSDLNLPLLLPFAIGAVLGLFLCAKGIGFLLNRYEQMTYSGILGFVVGSIFTLVPANFQLARDGLVCALVLIAGGLITYLFNRAGHS